MYSVCSVVSAITMACLSSVLSVIRDLLACPVIAAGALCSLVTARHAGRARWCSGASATWELEEPADDGVALAGRVVLCTSITPRRRSYCWSGAHRRDRVV